ncbi:MAG: hypothetical protein JST38_07890 [Bacteroidetes bacterium]|nr:hypothetical protein [Bacteroidota bacterium]MBS1940781.1 hypothetical protein [Bacteroidota bacterium]
MPSKRLLFAFLAVFAALQLLAAFIHHRVGVRLFVPFAIGAVVPFLMMWTNQRKK